MSALPDATSIRKALVNDTARIQVITRAAYSKYVPRIGREPAPMLTDFAKQIATGDVVVIEQARQVVGYMIARPQAEAYLIEDVAIDPARQGEGLGHQLMAHAVSEARRLKLSGLCLYTNAAMTENLSIYASMGFVETHRAIEDGYDRVYMRLVF